jgi:myosin heavy subunit
VYEVKDIDDGEEFKTTLKCMENIGFSEDEIKQIVDTSVAILLLGNIEFDNVSKSGTGDRAVVS